MEKAYCGAKLALIHHWQLQRLAVHPAFASQLHKDPSPICLRFYVSPGIPFSEPRQDHLVATWNFC